MARALGILLCFLIVAIDVVAGILGIQAEVEQNKVCHFACINQQLLLWFGKSSNMVLVVVDDVHGFDSN